MTQKVWFGGFQQIKAIAFTAVAFSVATLVGCLIAGPMIHAEITDVWEEIDREIAEFKVKILKF